MTTPNDIERHTFIWFLLICHPYSTSVKQTYMVVRFYVLIKKAENFVYSNVNYLNFMQYFRDYRVKCYIILTFIFLFIYLKLNSKSNDDKTQQPLSPGLTFSSNVYIFNFSFSYLLNAKENMISLPSNKRKKTTITIVLFLLFCRIRHEPH